MHSRNRLPLLFICCERYAAAKAIKATFCHRTERNTEIISLPEGTYVKDACLIKRIGSGYPLLTI